MELSKLNRFGQSKLRPSMLNGNSEMSEPIIHITNLPESMVLATLEELVACFGPYRRIYMARDYMTRLCKGFAYVTFKHHADAARAIQSLNEHVCDNSIIKVEWSEPRMAMYEESIIPFIASKYVENQSNDPIIDPSPRCGFCWGDHLWNHCPHKETSTKAARLADVKPPKTTFKRHAAAAEAIQVLNEHANDDNVPNVQWSKPQMTAAKTAMPDDSSVSPTTSKKEEKKSDDPFKNVSTCDFCSDNHQSNSCALKDKPAKGAEAATAKTPAMAETVAFKLGKCVPPFEASIAKGTHIRITNLPETMTIPGFQRLIKRIGPCEKMFLGRDPKTSLCKGFAFVTFKQHADAAKAIQALNGYAYDNNVLKVEWSKPKVGAPKVTMSDDSSASPTTSKKEENVKNVSNCEFCCGNHLSNRCAVKVESKVATAKQTSTSSGSVLPSEADSSACSLVDDTMIRITNLPETMTATGFQRLIKRFGKCNTIHLGRHSKTFLCNGIATVRFKQHADAARAIQVLNGHAYDNHVLKAEWSKPNDHASKAVPKESSTLAITNKDKMKKSGDSVVDPLKNIARCGFCSGNHLVSSCPLEKKMLKSAKVGPAKPSSKVQVVAVKPGKAVPPPKADPTASRRDNDARSVCISNLNEWITQADLEELVKAIGHYSKAHLACDLNTGRCKGFAFVTYKKKVDAAKAVQLLNGLGFDHLILNVEWFTPEAAARARTAMVPEDLNMEFITSKNIRKRCGKLADDIAMADANLVKYVPPYKEKHTNKTHRHGYTSIRISNLPESMDEAHFERLVKNIGPIKKTFLARDHNTALCKGFAFVKFAQHTDAVKAIKLLNGRNCDGLILKVEWCKLFARN